VVLSVILAGYMITNLIENNFDKVLESKARTLVTLTKDMEHGVELDFADEFMPEFSRNKNAEYFQLWNHNYKTFERSNSLSEHDLPYLSTDKLGYNFQNIDLVDGRKGRAIQIVFVPQVPDLSKRTDKKLASQEIMTLVVAVERESLISIINHTYIIAVFSTLLILLLIYLIISYTVRKILEPLHSLQENIEVLDADKLDSRLNNESSPKELKSLIAQFNALMMRLETSFLREQQFTSDVAHELRTPLSEIRTMSEIAIKWPDDSELTRDYYTDILSSSKQMQSIVNSLLDLVRCEKGRLTLAPEAITLKEIIDGCWLRFKSQIEEKRLELVCKIPDDLLIMISRIEFEIVICNLLSNAVNYSIDNSQVTVLISIENAHVIISIANKTRELTSEDIPIIFDKLWRKSQSRTSSEHVGLGLSIVNAYAEALNITVKAEYKEPDVFTIQLNNVPFVS
jgi:signal transduction histidine kinase